MQHEIDRFHFAGLLGEAGHRGGIGVAGKAGARLQHIGDQKPKHQREG